MKLDLDIAFNASSARQPGFPGKISARFTAQIFQCSYFKMRNVSSVASLQPGERYHVGNF